MIAEREGLLADIRENPHDDTPRLVFADWLDDHGEPERAAFIRAQVDAAAIRAVLAVPYPDGDLCTGVSASWCPVCGDCRCREPETRKDDPGCPLHSPRSRHAGDDSLMALMGETERRADGLLTRTFLPPPPGYTIPGNRVHGRYAFAGMPLILLPDPDRQGWDFHRGFVATVRCPLEERERHGKDVIESHPVERVEATDKWPNGMAVWGGEAWRGWLDADEMKRQGLHFADTAVRPYHLPGGFGVSSRTARLRTTCGHSGRPWTMPVPPSPRPCSRWPGATVARHHGA